MEGDNLAIKVEFERLMKQDPDGLLRPEAIVVAAENPSHPLHDKFEWDDDEAARLYRIQQAREVIRSFKIHIPQLQVEVRALTSLDVDRANGGGFRWTLEVLERPDLREEMIRTALKELNSLKSKYAHLTELNTIWDKISVKQQEIIKDDTLEEPKARDIVLNPIKVSPAHS